MSENGENGNTIRAFIVKFSRKLRDCYLPGLAGVKVTCETFFFFVCVCGLVHGKDRIAGRFA